MVEHRTPEREVGGFETDIRRVVSLSNTLYSPKVLVIPRNQRLRPDMNEKLLTGTLSLNTNKQTHINLLAFTNIHKAENEIKLIKNKFGRIIH